MLVLAEAFGELDGTPAYLDRTGDVAVEHPYEGEPGVGAGERRSGRCDLLQHGHPGGGGLQRLGAPADAPEKPGAAPQQRALPLTVTLAAPAPKRPVGGVERLRHPLGVLALEGIALQ
jgi:hypothetical protein